MFNPRFKTLAFFEVDDEKARFILKGSLKDALSEATKIKDIMENITKDDAEIDSLGEKQNKQALIILKKIRNNILQSLIDDKIISTNDFLRMSILSSKFLYKQLIKGDSSSINFQPELTFDNRQRYEILKQKYDTAYIYAVQQCNVLKDFSNIEVIDYVVDLALYKMNYAEVLAQCMYVAIEFAKQSEDILQIHLTEVTHESTNEINYIIRIVDTDTMLKNLSYTNLLYTPNLIIFDPYKYYVGTIEEYVIEKWPELATLESEPRFKAMEKIHFKTLYTFRDKQEISIIDSYAEYIVKLCEKYRYDGNINQSHYKRKIITRNTPIENKLQSEISKKINSIGEISAPKKIQQIAQSNPSAEKPKEDFYTQSHKHKNKICNQLHMKLSHVKNSEEKQLHSELNNLKNAKEKYENIFEMWLNECIHIIKDKKDDADIPNKIKVYDLFLKQKYNKQQTSKNIEKLTKLEKIYEETYKEKLHACLVDYQEAMNAYNIKSKKLAENTDVLAQPTDKSIKFSSLKQSIFELYPLYIKNEEQLFKLYNKIHKTHPTYKKPELLKYMDSHQFYGIRRSTEQMSDISDENIEKCQNYKTSLQKHNFKLDQEIIKLSKLLNTKDKERKSGAESSTQQFHSSSSLFAYKKSGMKHTDNKSSAKIKYGR